MKKKIIYFLIQILALTPFMFPMTVLAANTGSATFASASSQWLSAADSVSLSPTGDVSLQAWVKGTTFASDASVIIGRWADTGTNKSVLLYIGGTGGQICFNVESAGNNDDNLCKTYSFSTATWYHVTSSWQASAKTVTFYIGTESVAPASIGSVVGANTDAKDATANMEIGRNASGYYWNGLLDDVRFWASTRTLAQIQADYCTELAGNESGLNAYWKFNTGATLTDSTANANTLTNNNVVTFTSAVNSATCASPAAAKPPQQDVLIFE